MLLNAAALLLAIAFAATVILISAQRRNAPGATSLIIFALALMIWAISDFIYWRGVSPIEIFWLSAIYLGATVVPTALFTFAIEYTEHVRSLTRRLIVLLAIEPVLTQILFWTDPWSGLFFAGKGAERIGAIPYDSPWLRINAIYTYSLILTAFILMLQFFFRKPGAYRLQSGAILVGTLAPILAGIINHTGFNPTPHLDLTLMAFTITGLTLTCTLLNYRLLDLVPIPRDIVVEKMSDGLMVLDIQNRIVDLNPAAETLVGVRRRQLFGQPAEKLLSEWSNIIKNEGNLRELNIKVSVKLQAGWRYLHIRGSPLTDRFGYQIGQVIVLHDITEQRKVDDARQRSRDILFHILQGISSAASQTLNTEDFLTATIHKLSHTFHCEAGVVFLMEEYGEGSGIHRLTLASHYGLPSQVVNSMTSLPNTDNFAAWILEQNEPQLIPDISTYPLVPTAMQQFGNGPLLLVPMRLEDHLVGIIGLYRKGGPIYRNDEIANMSAIAEEVATFIQGDRQRRSVIALAERLRLVRDLHDSISHNLYGVVSLTEAAQAGVEASSSEKQAEFLSRIGEAARLAVKEMRLFLHELQPSDLEKEGLVPVLHQRLAAVEGRSNVKALLITNYNGCLPLKKEVMLYYIAQEALNNVLRHSHAKAVTIRLKQRKGNVILEVEDQGAGFDPSMAYDKGMGLRNMQERASLVGGKLKIISAPGKGTKIIVTIKRDRK